MASNKDAPFCFLPHRIKALSVIYLIHIITARRSRPLVVSSAQTVLNTVFIPPYLSDAMRPPWALLEHGALYNEVTIHSVDGFFKCRFAGGVKRRSQSHTNCNPIKRKPGIFPFDATSLSASQDSSTISYIKKFFFLRKLFNILPVKCSIDDCLIYTSLILSVCYKIVNAERVRYTW